MFLPEKEFIVSIFSYVFNNYINIYFLLYFVDIMYMYNSLFKAFFRPVF